MTTGRTAKTSGDAHDALAPAGTSGAPPGEILLYQTEDGRTRVECRFADETLWLSQALIAELFQKDVRTINEHVKNIYREDELEAGATIRKFRKVRREGDREGERDGMETLEAAAERLDPRNKAAARTSR